LVFCTSRNGEGNCGALFGFGTVVQVVGVVDRDAAANPEYYVSTPTR
jgi:hypothetical protein